MTGSFLLACALVVATVGAAVAQPSVPSQDQHGILQQYDPSARVVTMADGRRYRITDRTVVIVDGRPMEAHAVAPGWRVVLRGAEPVELREGRWVASSAPPATVRQPEPQVTAQGAEGRTIYVQAPQPRIDVQVPPSRIVVQQPAPEIVVQQPQPQVVVQPAPEPRVTLQPQHGGQPPVAAQDQPAALPRETAAAGATSGTDRTVTVQAPQPRIDVQIPPSTIVVQQPAPQVVVEQAQPEVVVQPAPAPRVISP